MAYEAIVITFFYFFKIFITAVNTIPPDRCFSNFRWDDCGQPATPVIYYYKSGSRCEVGMWRGCLPNVNMFENEYECVATCIFTMRAMPPDYHNLIDQYPDNEISTIDTAANTTEPSNTTSNAAEDATIDDGKKDDENGDKADGDKPEGDDKEKDPADNKEEEKPADEDGEKKEENPDEKGEEDKGEEEKKEEEGGGERK